MNEFDRRHVVEENEEEEEPVYGGHHSSWKYRKVNRFEIVIIIETVVFRE